jgi:hypothetical protein
MIQMISKVAAQSARVLNANGTRIRGRCILRNYGSDAGAVVGGRPRESRAALTAFHRVRDQLTSIGNRRRKERDPRVGIWMQPNKGKFGLSRNASLVIVDVLKLKDRNLFRETRSSYWGTSSASYGSSNATSRSWPQDARELVQK